MVFNWIQELENYPVRDANQPNVVRTVDMSETLTSRTATTSRPAY